MRETWLLLRKDVLVELRTREVLATMGLFALLLVVVFAFAFSVDETRARLVAPGIVWVVVLFSATLGLGRVIDREREGGCLEALLLSPVGPGAIYLAKSLGVLLFALVCEALTLPMMLIFLGVELPTEGIGLFSLALFLGTAGFALVGTLFASMLAATRMKEVLLPLVVYPVVVPVVIGGVELTTIALGGGLPSDARGWLELMAGFDLLFGALCAWLYGRVMLD